MRKKVLMSSYSFLCCFFAFLIFFKPANGCEVVEDKYEQGFYVISPLLFHLDAITSNEDERNAYDNAISFNEEDVSHLWTLASEDLYYFPQLEDARKYYYQAKSQTDVKLAEELYGNAKAIVKKIWDELDAYVLDKHAPQKKPIHPLIGHLALLAHQSGYPNFDENPKLDDKMRKQIKPYLIPLTHPAKTILDDIFSKGRVTKNEETFADAGFITVSVRPFSFIVVSKHPDLPGYLQKIYLDSEKRVKHSTPGWQWLVYRCQGAENVRNLIKSKKLQFFSVPDKWIYPLPAPDEDTKLAKNAQPIILLVTDMELASQEESEEAWKSKVTKKHIDELYIILSHGFASCHLSWNIPLTKNGKFCCIDTEHPKRKPKYHKVKPYLSKEMGEYLDKLVKNGGKDKK